ncbi:ribosome maturation factor RimP [Anaerosalibacter massiliensis]|uniref:Ribosome maturation factor RimP n=1 Tax=Anaerosalibacter massiliensis TaxID=1347392 RepID=A0A9X2MGE5_9FIRM|nr:ribosome maturation factor RimP [Anaerosalibacter massiliensis]MCR2042732.1 ribosome maturation factor RimP [Anaerosalibacter massiliensis]
MRKKDIISLIYKISESKIKEFGYELVDVEFVKEGKNHFLRVFVDKPGGITIDDCQNVSEFISNSLDEHDPINIPYYLEVSSPGLDRPFKTDKDFNRNLGEIVEVSLYKNFKEKKNYIGELLSFNKDMIKIIDSDLGEIEIPREIISKINLAVIF